MDWFDHVLGMAGWLLKKQLATAHFGSKIGYDIKVLGREARASRKERL